MPEGASGRPLREAPSTRRARRRPVGRRGRPSAEHQRRRRLRLLYFALAAVWGYVAGTAAVLGTLSMTGRPLPIDGNLVSGMVLAAVLALVGGAVASVAYREAVRRGSM